MFTYLLLQAPEKVAEMRFPYWPHSSLHMRTSEQ